MKRIVFGWIALVVASLVALSGCSAPSAGKPTTVPIGQIPANITVNPTAEIDSLRGRIDGYDDQIIALLVERTMVSKEIQALRLQAGGGKVDSAREVAIIKKYLDQVGVGGDGIARAILQASRGKVASTN
jgi:chorismate mutase